MATFTRSSSRKIPSWVFLLLVAAAVVGWLGAVFGRWPVWVSRPLDAISAFSAVFLSIFIEALPFLLLGTVASGIVEVFFGPDEFSRWMPRNPLLASLAGSLLGMFFPVCECGVVPLSRRMLRKGLPEQAGVAFLLGAPVLNPVVMASTLAAFGWGPVFWGRIGLTLLVAVLAGLILPILP
ncbi:MAG TPA: permease, partial [Anaerolineales bacterium]